MGKEQRVRKGEMYYVASRDPNDPVPVYKVRERGDFLDELHYREGRYFLTREEAVMYILSHRGVKLSQGIHTGRHSVHNKRWYQKNLERIKERIRESYRIRKAKKGEQAIIEDKTDERCEK